MFDDWEVEAQAGSVNFYQGHGVGLAQPRSHFLPACVTVGSALLPAEHLEAFKDFHSDTSSWFTLLQLFHNLTRFPFLPPPTFHL